MGDEDEVAAAFEDLAGAEDLLHQRVDGLDLLADEIEGPASLEQALAALDEETGDGRVRVIRRIGEHDIEGLLLRSADGRSRMDLEAGDAEIGGVDFGESQGAEVAVHEG